MRKKMEVVFFQRKPLPFHKSLEYIFNDVRSRLPHDVSSITKVFSVYSKGVLNRLRIMWEAWLNQGDVNHITGDIHFAAIWLKKHKTMLTVLDCGLLSSSKGVKHFLLKYFWFTLPLKRCSLVTVISEATKQELLKYATYDPEDIHVIPVAISPAYKFFTKTFNKARPVILLVGTMPNKNVDAVLEAVKGISCHLNIIGPLTDNMKEKLHAFSISYSNHVDISQEQLVEQYVQCDMLSFVSTYEGFGMPIVEANATGRPVITSDILSMPEVAGKAACLVNPYNIQQIRAGILRIIEDDLYRQSLVQEGFENIKRFDPYRIAMMYYKLYESIVIRN